MKKDIEVLGIITARGGSKTIPRKNIKEIAGNPLIYYTIDAANKSKNLSRYIVSTDDKEIANYSKSLGVEVPFLRPSKLASDRAKSIDVIIHTLSFLKKDEGYVPNFVMILQPTSPLRTSQDIDNSIALLNNSSKTDSLVSVVEIPHNFFPEKIMKIEGKFLIDYLTEPLWSRRQDLSHKYYVRNGAAIYISKYSLLMKKRKIIGKYCIPYIMLKERSIDIDDKFDWELAEYLLTKSKAN